MSLSGERVELRAHPTTYTLMPEACLRGEPMDTADLYPVQPIKVEWRGGDTWAVTRGSFVWCHDTAEFEYEPLPSSRTAEFRGRSRFKHYEALSIAAFLVDEHSDSNAEGDR